MADAVSASNFTNASLLHDLQGVTGEKCVGYRDIARCSSIDKQQASRLRDGVCGAGYIIHQNHFSTGKHHVGQCQVHRPVALTYFATYAVIEPMASCCPSDTLSRLFVRAQQQRILSTRRNEISQQRGGAEHNGVSDGHYFLQRGNLVQVRIDGDQCTEKTGQKPSNNALTDSCVGMKSYILARVEQIRRHQRQVLKAQVAHGLRG